MSQENEWIKTDLRKQIEHYREDLDILSKKYFDLQKKFEMMKALELNLRHEIFQLKQQLNDRKTDNNIFHQYKEQQMYLKYISILIEDLNDLFNQTIYPSDELRLDHKVENSENLHRPLKENNQLIGLGKESLLRMKDSHETNEKKPLQKEDIQTKETEQMKDSSDQDLNKQNHMDKATNQQSSEELTDKKNEHPSREKNEVNNFNELKRLVYDLKRQSNSSEQQFVEKKSDKISTGKESTVKNQRSRNRSPSFTFRDLQKAKNIYSKPLPRMNKITTTSINRKIEDHILRKDPLNNPEIVQKKSNDMIKTEKKKEIHEHEIKEGSEPELQRQEKKGHSNQEKQLETSEGNQRKSIQKGEINQQGQVEKTKINYPNEQAETNEKNESHIKSSSRMHVTKSKDNKEKANNSSQELEKLSNNKDVETSTTDSQMNENSLLTNHQKNDERTSDGSAKDRKVEINNFEHLILTESESNQNITNEVKLREAKNAEYKQAKNESFFKSLWNRFK